MQEHNFILSDSAVKRLQHVLGSKPQGTCMRISVEGGGCSGFQYKFELDDTATDDDIRIERDGATVLVDPMSLEFLGGSMLDYQESLGAAHFSIENPNATAQCGCGNSFAV